MILGAVAAMGQENIKRLMAYSSIGHMGYALAGILTGTIEGTKSTIMYLTIYAVMNVGIFACIFFMKRREKYVENIKDLSGLSKTNPLLAVGFLIMLFSLAGIPPLAGFFGKFFLFTAAAQQGYYILVLIAVLNSIISLYYYLIVVKSMFIDKSETPIPTFSSDMAMKIGLVICVLGIVVTGFYGNLFDHLMQIGAHFTSAP